MIGTQIGPFVLQRLLGAGGMGSVYLAKHALMDDLHAIKILDPQLTQHEHVVTRFINEARAAAKLRHRNLIRVHNIDRMPDGAWYMVLDFLDGTTLAGLIASHGVPIGPQLTLQLLAQVGNCIQHVHDHRIVHRDLKPENIFLVRTAEDPQFPVVLDLGVAQLNAELATGPVTRTGTVVGTPIYMAPEQLRGERVTAAADVFALGVIAYEMCTGGYFPYQQAEARNAYLSLPATEIYFRQRAAVVVDPRHRNPALGPAWSDVLRAALDVDPARRPASARALVLGLAEALDADHPGAGGVEIVARVAHELLPDRGGARPSRSSVPLPRAPTDPRFTPLPPESPTVSTLTGTASQSVPKLPPARRWGIVAIVAATVIAIGAIGAFAVGGKGERRTPATAPAAVVDTGSNAVAAAVTEPAITSAPPPAAAAPPPAEPAPAPTAPEPPANTPAPAAAATPPPAAAPTPPPAKPPAAAVTAVRKPGVLRIIVRPWAQIWLNGSPAGETPYRNKLPAGRYQLRIANQFSHKDETLSITVNPDQTTTVERSW